MKACIRALMIFIGMILAMTVSGVMAEEQETQPFILPEELIRINPYGGKEADPESIFIQEKDEIYYLFLPSNTVPDKATVYYETGISTLSIDDAEVHSGECCSLFTAEGEHILKTRTGERKLYVYCSTDVPVMFVQTESGTMDHVHENKDNKEPALFSIYSDASKTVENGTIKGRGNATWVNEKKPYNIKFEKKTDVLGMGRGKKWSLLANYCDPSLIRNALGWFLADQLNLHYTPDYRHIDLYINGVYLGNYLLCERVNVADGRIEIHDLEKDNELLNGNLKELPQGGISMDKTEQDENTPAYAKWISMPFEPDNITGGYLLELDYKDRYKNELCGFITDYGQCVILKSPEYAGEKEVRYIRAFVSGALEALYAENGVNAEGKHYSEYFDLETMVDMYILQEISKNIDAGLSSLFMYKDMDKDRLMFSPAWDMDRAFGDMLERYGTIIGDPWSWWANSLYYIIGDGENRLGIPSVFNLAFRHPEFREKVTERWKEIRENKVLETCKEFIRTTTDKIEKASLLDSLRWNHFESTDIEGIRTAYHDFCAQGIDFLENRFVALDNGFSSDNAMLYYDANGGQGGIFNKDIVFIDDSVDVYNRVSGDSRIFPPEDEPNYYFLAWNTLPDGSGDYYLPGETIQLETESTTLYAIWFDLAKFLQDFESLDYDAALIAAERYDEIYRINFDINEGIKISEADTNGTEVTFWGSEEKEQESPLYIRMYQPNVYETSIDVVTEPGRQYIEYIHQKDSGECVFCFIAFDVDSERYIQIPLYVEKYSTVLICFDYCTVDDKIILNDIYFLGTAT